MDFVGWEYNGKVGKTTHCRWRIQGRTSTLWDLLGCNWSIIPLPPQNIIIEERWRDRLREVGTGQTLGCPTNQILIDYYFIRNGWSLATNIMCREKIYWHMCEQVCVVVSWKRIQKFCIYRDERITPKLSGLFFDGALLKWNSSSTIGESF